MIDFKKYTHAALFAGGLLFGTAGLKLLSSKDAKNVYAHTTAAALRVKDCVMKGVDKIQESTADIVATAKQARQPVAKAAEAAELEAKAAAVEAAHKANEV